MFRLHMGIKTLFTQWTSGTITPASLVSDLVEKAFTVS